MLTTGCEHTDVYRKNFDHNGCDCINLTIIFDYNGCDHIDFTIIFEYNGCDHIGFTIIYIFKIHLHVWWHLLIM